MYIEPFWCGVIATILFEVAVPICYLIIVSIGKEFRKENKDNEQNNS